MAAVKSFNAETMTMLNVKAAMQRQWQLFKAEMKRQWHLLKAEMQRQ